MIVETGADTLSRPLRSASSMTTKHSRMLAFAVLTRFAQADIVPEETIGNDYCNVCRHRLFMERQWVMTIASTYMCEWYILVVSIDLFVDLWSCHTADYIWERGRWHAFETSFNEKTFDKFDLSFWVKTTEAKFFKFFTYNTHTKNKVCVQLRLYNSIKYCILSASDLNVSWGWGNANA